MPAMVRFLALLLLVAAPAWAGYDQGVAAWGRGDYATAAREFAQSAHQGHAESQFMLGRLHAMGDGVRQDWVQAWLWHDRAARQGHAMARDARDSLEAIMNAAQLAQARAAAAPPSVAAMPQAQPYAGLEPPAGRRRVMVVPRAGVVGEQQAGRE